MIQILRTARNAIIAELETLTHTSEIPLTVFPLEEEQQTSTHPQYHTTESTGRTKHSG